MDEGLLDLIYEAAISPDLWPTALKRFFDAVGGSSGALTWQNQANGAGAAVEVRVDPTASDLYFGYFASRNPLIKVDDPDEFMRRWRPVILTDEDWMAKDELVRSEYYNDFMSPLDVHSALFIRLAARGLDAAHINIARPKRRGQFTSADIELANHIHPHLIRAFNLGQKLEAASRAREEMGEFLEGSGYGILLLSADGSIRHVNRAGRALLAEKDGLTAVAGRLAGPTQQATNRLQGLISAAASSETGRRGGAMALATASRRLPLSVLVAPVRSERFVLTGGGRSVIVCVTDLEAGVSLPEQRLRDLFALSSAEAKVAMALFRGLSPREAAAELGTSFYTVRSQLVSIFAKTQTNRQAELVRLMMRAIDIQTC